MSSPGESPPLHSSKPSSTSLLPMPPLVGLSASPSTAELTARMATQLQLRHAASIGSLGSQMMGSPRASTASLHSARKARTHGASTHSLSSAAATAAASAAGAPPPRAHAALTAVHRADADGIASRKKGVYHHLPPLTEEEKTTLFDTLPSLRALDDVPVASVSLRELSLSIIRQWLSDKLSSVSWVALIQKIKLMAEGGEHTLAHVPEKNHILSAMGLDAHSLQAAGIPPPLVHRIYTALWVYSEGVRSLITEVSHHAKKSGGASSSVVGNIWKCYAILLEDFQGDEYITAMCAVEVQSQRVLRDMEERFARSLQLKQDNEAKSASESALLSTLLDRSHHELRTLQEHRDALTQELHHLRVTHSDLESMYAELKKESWFTANKLNRLTAKYEELQRDSKEMEHKLKQDIHELKLEQEEVKSSLDQELATNERLSYKVDRFASNIADLTTSTARMRADLNEKVQEVKLINKVLENTSHEVAALERDKANIQALADAKIDAAVAKQHEAEAALRDLEQLDLRRQEDERQEKLRRRLEAEEQLAREEQERGDGEAEDPIASSSMVRDLRAQLVMERAAHDKEVTGMQQRNEVMSERIRTLQKRVRELGGGRRFAIIKKEEESESDSSGEDSSAESTRAPSRLSLGKGGLQSVTEKLRRVSTRPQPPPAAVATTPVPRRATNGGALGTDDDAPSTPHSASSSRRNSRKRGSSNQQRGSGAGAAGGGGNGGAFLAMEMQSLQSELDSKEKLNTNLLVSINKLKITLSQREEELKRANELLVTTRKDQAAVREALREEQQARSTLGKKVADQHAELDSLRKLESTCTELRSTVHELQESKIALLSSQSSLSSSLTEHIRESKASRAEAKAQRTSMAKMREEIKALRTECDARCKNQNELGMRIRTLAMENSSLQSLNDEIQRNLRSSTDASSLLGSLEMKSAEINRLALRIRDMEHVRIETLKTHELRLAEAKSRGDHEADRRIEEALATEAARNKKLRAQIQEHKIASNKTIEALRGELSAAQNSSTAAQGDREKLSKDNDRLNKQMESMQAEFKERNDALVAQVAAAQAAAAQAQAMAAQQPAASPAHSPIASSESSVPVSPTQRAPTSTAFSSSVALLLPSPTPSPPPSSSSSSAVQLVQMGSVSTPVASPRTIEVVIPATMKRASTEGAPVSPHPVMHTPALSPSPSASSLPPTEFEELTLLLSSDHPVSAPALSSAVAAASARVTERLAASKSQIHALQSQVDALRAKLRGAGDDGHQQQSHPSHRRRKHKKNMSVANVAFASSLHPSPPAGTNMVPSADEADPTFHGAGSSSDEEARKHTGAAAPASSRHTSRASINAKRASAGRSDAPASPQPPHTSSSATSQARSSPVKTATPGPKGFKDTPSLPPAAAGSGPHKSPRSTLARGAALTLPPTLRRAVSMSSAAASSSNSNAAVVTANTPTKSIPQAALPPTLVIDSQPEDADLISHTTLHTAHATTVQVASAADNDASPVMSATPARSRTLSASQLDVAPEPVVEEDATGSPIDSDTITRTASDGVWPVAKSSATDITSAGSEVTPRAPAAPVTSHSPVPPPPATPVRTLHISTSLSSGPSSTAASPLNSPRSLAPSPPTTAPPSAYAPSSRSHGAHMNKAKERDTEHTSSTSAAGGAAATSAAVSAAGIGMTAVAEAAHPAVAATASPAGNAKSLKRPGGPSVSSSSPLAHAPLVLLSPASGAISTALVSPRGTRSGSISISTSAPTGQPAAIGSVVTGMLSPAAAMAALKQLKQKVVSNRGAVNFPRL